MSLPAADGRLPTTDYRLIRATDTGNSSQRLFYDVRVPSVTSTIGSAAPARTGAAVVGAILLAVGLAAALSVDVVKTGQGVKGDEATYVAMALSVAYDGDLAYERRDLDRFFGLYRWGPDGIFLKRGKQVRVRIDASPPFVHLRQTPDLRPDRLYFSKSLIYPVVAAPFVRLLGLNGMLVLNVLLLAVACACAYQFLAARSKPTAALVFALAFVFASCVPIYLVFLAPEIFNFTLVAVAYFLWLQKDASPVVRSRFLASPASDLYAAALLGVATYSKPSHALLVAPIVLAACWRRKWMHAFAVGGVAVAAAALLFAVNAAATGEFNYQGGDRRTFYTRFPFDGSGQGVFAEAPLHATNDSDAQSVFQDFPNRFAHNVEYFFIGRHFGFVPYFFPGAVAIGLWLASADRREPSRILTLLAVAVSAGALLVFAPYSWSGGGGPPGNRYFMSLYPALLFLTPPLTGAAPALAAWAGGALFTAKMLVNPFVIAKSPTQLTERGFARRLPVEVTMANDLPIMLEGGRAHAWYNDVLLYFLDEHVYPPETIDADGHKGIWIAGDGRADILMRSDWPVAALRVTASSPIPTIVTMSAGAGRVTVPLQPGKPETFDVPASGTRDEHSFAYLVTARSSEGFTPRLRDPSSADPRNLGALLRFTAVAANR